MSATTMQLLLMKKKVVLKSSIGRSRLGPTNTYPMHHEGSGAPQSASLLSLSSSQRQPQRPSGRYYSSSSNHGVGSNSAAVRRSIKDDRSRRRSIHSDASSSSSSSPSSSTTWLSRMRASWRKTPVRWTPLPIAGGIALLVAINIWKQQREATNMQIPHGPDFRDGTYDHAKDNMPTVKGPWQVHVIGALPLRTISRIYGALNSYTLPVWFRVPGYKLYSWIFGVNLSECEPEDLKAYSSLSEFFLRKLKPGVRPIHDEYLLVSPADGRVVNFGYIENRRVEQVKGVSYSLDALLSGSGQLSSANVSNPKKTPSDVSMNGYDGNGNGNGNSNASTTESQHAHVDEQEFANLNGLHYTVDQLMGQEPHQNQVEGGQVKAPARAEEHDASISEATPQSKSDSRPSDPPDHPQSQHSFADQIAIATETFDPASPHWTSRGVPKEGNKMFFCVIYLAPGDYHRFHSPTNWVVERRRHFAGELFSVSPYMSKLLKDLFVLNERVALLGRWRHGFFGMVPVGATNVGSIRINFDADLRTNSPTRPKVPGEFTEATYAKSSTLLQGKPCVVGEEMGGFMLGSTIVLVFEADKNFVFSTRRGDKVKVGEPLGDHKDKIGKLLQEQKAREMLNR